MQKIVSLNLGVTGIYHYTRVNGFIWPLTRHPGDMNINCCFYLALNMPPGWHEHIPCLI